MITFEDDKTIIIPLAYNIFVNNLNSEGNVPRFIKENMLEEHHIEELIKCINMFPNNTLIAINMEYISFVQSRIFENFKNVSEISRVFFYNINVTSVRERLVEDTSEAFGKELKINNDKLCFSAVTYNTIVKDEYQNSLNKIILNSIAEIIQSITEDRVQFLDSSGIWSNKYVDLKKLFLNSNNYTYIIYKMADIVQKYYNKADALISTSKTGSVFANLIGQLVNKKVVNCVGIGPKFSLAIDIVKNSIRKDKKYLYICDFICLGTELKILNALIKSEKSDLIGGVGVAAYIDTNSEKLRDSIMGKIKCLINVLECNIDYKISIFEEELLGGK